MEVSEGKVNPDYYIGVREIEFIDASVEQDLKIVT